MSTEAKHRQWLLGELPALVAQGILDEPAARRLRARYGGDLDGAAARDRSGQRLLLAFAILGGGLVGLGIILLFAHNWDDLSRPVRVVLSLVPLLTAQGLGIWALRRGAGPGWREGIAAFWLLAITAAIGLISQTYQIQGTIEGFLFTCLLLSLPVVLLLDSAAAALLWLAGLVWWPSESSWDPLQPFLFAAGLLAVASLWRRRWDQAARASAATLEWALGLTAMLSWWALFKVGSPPELVSFGILFAGLLLLGRHLGHRAMARGRAVAWVERPFEIFGVTGLVILLSSTSFDDAWSRWGQRRQPTLDAGEWPMAVLLLTAFAALAWAAWRRRDRLGLWFASAVPVLLLAQVFHPPDQPLIAALLVNLLLFALGLRVLVAGYRWDHLGTANLGLVILALLAILRFFDSDLGLAERGIFFVLVGAGFLAANLLLIRRRRVER